MELAVALFFVLALSVTANAFYVSRRRSGISTFMKVIVALPVVAIFIALLLVLFNGK